jgi:NAD(P)-dependent dehydrogenase (short-subunit alcohol dehydrogenase family)
MKRLEQKIIVVTGGNGLLGSRILKQLQHDGAITINAEIQATDDLSKGMLHCDITNSASIQATIEKVTKAYGRIDGLVNNAYPRTKDWGKKFEDIPLESWQKNVDMQLNSVFNFCQQMLGLMKEQKHGSIVNISSIYGSVGPDFTVYDGTEMTMPAAYAAIKGGVVNLTRYLAAYYGPYGVRINCVSPGGIFDQQPQSFVSAYEKKVPMRRMGLPEDIAAPVAFLLSDEAAYITGHNLMVDGGWTAI